MNRRALLALLVALGVAIGLGWLARERSAPQTGADTARGPDVIAEGVEVIETDVDGIPRRRLEITQARYFELGRSGEFGAVEVRLMPPDGPAWRLQAAGGASRDDGRMLELAGAVTITRDAGSDGRAVRLETADLSVDLERGHATTARQARFVSAADWLMGTGLDAWFDGPGRIRLHADVRGYYAPP